MDKIEIAAVSDGTVEIVVADAKIALPAEEIGALAAELLAAAQRASVLAGFKYSERSESLRGIISFRPMGLGLSLGKPPEPQSLVVHAGKARFGIALDASLKAWLLSALHEAQKGGGHQH